MNNKDGLISVIVPIYKVEQFLDECVESILCQTYTKFELILVDDGSPDRCGKMCDAYKEKDTRIRVIHKENGGLSDARNAGMKIAMGEYFTFVDSDDFVSNDYLAVLMQAAQEYDADIVQGDFTEIKDKLGTKNNYQAQLFTREEALVSLLKQKTVHVSAWAKLYRRESFFNIEYPKGRINEDKLTIYKNIWNSLRIVCIPKCIYFYRLNDASIMHSNFSRKRFEILSFQQEIEAYLGEEAKQFESEIEYSQIRMAVWLINDCISANKDSAYRDEINRCQSILKECRHGLKYSETKYKLMVPMILYAYPIYRKLVKAGRK